MHSNHTMLCNDNLLWALANIYVSFYDKRIIDDTIELYVMSIISTACQSIHFIDIAMGGQIRQHWFYIHRQQP